MTSRTPILRVRVALLAALLMAACGASYGAAVSFVSSPPDFAGYTLSHARYDANAGAVVVDPHVDSRSCGAVMRGVVESPMIECSFPFDTAILSWNASTPRGSYLVCYMQARAGGVWSRWIKTALWTRESTVWPRTTFKGEKDSIAFAQTSQMGLSKKADAIRLRVHMETADGRTYPALRFLGVQLSDSQLCREDAEPVRSAWGKDLDVPILSQLSVPRGNVWCSPTSVAMVLRYWGGKLQRRDLSTIGITEAARGIFDASWGGTGNWAFNAAWAGEHPGIRAYAIRLSGIHQIEQYIAKDVPVVVSVDYNKLRRREGKRMGHLMVIRGFTEDGKPIFNDPWGDPKQPEKLRKVFSRQGLEDAWLGESGSYGTVYIIHPEGYKL